MSSTDPDAPDCMDEGFLSCREDCAEDDDASPTASSASVTTTSPTSGVTETSASSFADVGGNIEGDLAMSECEDSKEDVGDDEGSSKGKQTEEAESTPPSATIGDDFLVFRKAPKRSFVKASSESSSAELKPKKSSVAGIVDYPSSSSSSSSSTTTLDSDDDSDEKEISNSAHQTKSTANPEIEREGSRVEEDEGNRVGPRIRRRLGPRARPRLFRDDSDDDDDAEDVDAGQTTNAESREGVADDDDEDEEGEDKEEEDEDLGILPVGPKPNWVSLKELRHRENGGSKSRGDEYQGDFIKKTQAGLLWVEKFDLTCRLDDHQGCVNSLHFNESGTWLASGSDDLNVIIWDWARAANSSRDREYVADHPVSPGSSRQRRMWARDRDESLSPSSAAAIVAKYESGHRANIFQTKFLPFTNDGVVISCARDGQIRIADLDSDGSARHGTRKLAVHKGSAHKLSTLSDSSHVILSCGEDAAVKSVDLRADDPDCDILVTREGSVRVPLYSIHVNPLNSVQFITSGRDPWVRFYDRRMLSSTDDDASGSTKKNAASPVKKFCPHPLVPQPPPVTDKRKRAPYHQKANVSCAVFSHDGSQILASYNDDDIYLFDASHSDGADSVKRYQGHRNNATVKGVNFYGPRSEYVVSGSDCGHVFIWDKETEQVVQFLPGDEGGVVNVLEPHPYLPYLATSGLDHDVKLWSPIKDGGPDFSSLLKTMKKNGKERESETGGDGALMDGHMLWFLMQHLRRRRRRRMRAEGSGDADEDDGDDDEDNDNSTGEEEENEEGDDDDVSRVVDCNPS